MSAVDRAAEIIDGVPTEPITFCGDVIADEVDGRAVAAALADAGLLVTDEIQAVLSMLVHWRTGDRGKFTLDLVAPLFIDAYLASRGET